MTQMETIAGKVSIGRAVGGIIARRLSRSRTRSRDILATPSGLVIGVSVEEATTEAEAEGDTDVDADAEGDVERANEKRRAAAECRSSMLRSLRTICILQPTTMPAVRYGVVSHLVADGAQSTASTAARGLQYNSTIPVSATANILPWLSVEERADGRSRYIDEGVGVANGGGGGRWADQSRRAGHLRRRVEAGLASETIVVMVWRRIWLRCVGRTGLDRHCWGTHPFHRCLSGISGGRNGSPQKNLYEHDTHKIRRTAHM